MQGAVRLQSRGAWTTTLANAWGTLAVEKFARAFESVPVKGTTTASLAAASQKLDWAHDPSGGDLSLRVAAGASRSATSITTAAEIRGCRFARAPRFRSSRRSRSGYRITRTLSAVDKNHSGGWRRGDIVRVHLKIEAQTDMTWVVVNDPLPAGASHLGTGLRRDSAIATAGENAGADISIHDYYWPAFVERPFDAFRAYYEYIPKGTFEVEYTIRLNQAGVFQLPTTRVEALYEPEMLGELPNAPFEVAP